MDLGLTTFLFLIINCLLMILGIVKIVISLILIIISLFNFAPVKEASFCGYIINAIVFGFNEIAIVILGILAGNKNNVRFLNTYQVFLFIIIVFKILSLSPLNQMENRIKRDMNLSLTDSMSDQRAKISTSSKAEDIQRHFHCCGTDGPEFWTRLEANISIPRSCCSNDVSNCTTSNAYKDGCLYKMIFTLPHVIFEIYRISMIPVLDTILFIVGIILIIMVMRTSSNSLA